MYVCVYFAQVERQAPSVVLRVEWWAWQDDDDDNNNNNNNNSSITSTCDSPCLLGATMHRTRSGSSMFRLAALMMTVVPATALASDKCDLGDSPYYSLIGPFNGTMNVSYSINMSRSLAGPNYGNVYGLDQVGGLNVMSLCFQ